MKSLKRKSLRTNLLLLIIYAIAFIGFAGVAAPSLVLLLKGPADFDSLDFDENIVVVFVDNNDSEYDCINRRIMINASEFINSRIGG